MTRDELYKVFEGLGLRGNHLVVHTAHSGFEAVEGGPRALCSALIDAVGDTGTIVMPAFTHAETLGGPSGNSASGGGAGRRAVAFHPDLPVSAELGPVAEAFRHLPGVLRSNHPTHSFAAWGRQARDVLSTQRDNNPLGPLKKLNVMQGQVLLLGTMLDAVSALHLAQERVGAAYLSRRVAVRVNAAGYAERVVLESVPGCNRGFIKLEERLDPAKLRVAALPNGTARKIPIRYLVTLATKFLESEPDAFVCEDPACPSCAVKHDPFSGTRFGT